MAIIEFDVNIIIEESFSYHPVSGIKCWTDIKKMQYYLSIRHELRTCENMIRIKRIR
jgi:hypothetical protein